MSPDEYATSFRWFNAYLRGFVGDDGVLPSPLELKRLHSLRVADNTHRIARELGMTGTELELTHAAGLLHDVGRFTQFSRYGSFRDADTIDHGEEGRVVLEPELSRLFSHHHDRERLLSAIRYHNRKADDIPTDLRPSHLALLRLVRDADKIDIMKIVLGAVERDGFQELPTMLPGIRLSREVTQAILARVMRRESLSIASLATLGDFLVLVSTWFHDLNYAPSRELAARQGYLIRLRRALPSTNDLARYFEDLATDYPHPPIEEAE